MRNLWEFEKYKLILQGLLLTVVSYVGVPTPQAFAFPSLCHQETTEKQDEVAFATSYEMVKSGSQKTRVRYPDHTAELKLGPPFSSCRTLPLIHTAVERQHPWVLGRSRLADSFCPHLLQPGSLGKDRFTLLDVLSGERSVPGLLVPLSLSEESFIPPVSCLHLPATLSL